MSKKMCFNKIKEKHRARQINGVFFEKSASVSFANKKQKENYIMKTCPNCNAQLDDNAQFCTSCGAEIKAETPVVAAAAHHLGGGHVLLPKHPLLRQQLRLILTIQPNSIRKTSLTTK